MKFISCRGDNGKEYSLSHCVLGAYADDGGMFLPSSLPSLSRSTLQQWARLSFQQLVMAFMRGFIEEQEVPTEDLKRIIADSFNKFTRRDPTTGKDVVEEMGFQPLVSSASETQREVTVAELWHGHTLAFKDLPLQFLGGLLSYFLSKNVASTTSAQSKRINVLVGTSGDTGSAAIESVRNSPHVNIFVLYPSGGRITRIQELQMTTILNAPGQNNLNVVACDGTSDDLDVPILQLFEKDPTFKSQFKLCSINSVNIIRILMQCTHFIYAYLRECPNVDREVDFVLPTGAAGHIAAGVLTKQLGVPIGQLVAATNENDVLSTFLNTGSFFPRSTGAIQTSSPAIDIQVPYNVERIIYLMATGNAQAKAKQVREYLQALTSPASRYELSSVDFARYRSFGLRGHSTPHSQVLRTIRETDAANRYLIDPHTAVAVAAGHALPAGSAFTSNRAVVFATAHAAKFLPTMEAATGKSQQDLLSSLTNSPYTNVRRATVLHTLPTNSIPFAKGEDWEAKLRQLIVKVNQQQALQNGNLKLLKAKL